eukprot:15495823-Heterocapsa_arctica.AAC.1
MEAQCLPRVQGFTSQPLNLDSFATVQSTSAKWASSITASSGTVQTRQLTHNRQQRRPPTVAVAAAMAHGSKGGSAPPGQ